MLGSLAEGTTVIDNFLDGEDCLRTIHIFQEVGVNISLNGTNVTIKSKGFRAFQQPTVPLYLGNSGTTARRKLGILASMPFSTGSYGDPHGPKRPMDRELTPSNKRGAHISGK